MLTPETIIHERYCIVRLVGQGATGAVYEAIDQRIGQTVALKQTLTPDPAAMGALEREALILAGLRHPALPVVSDTFADPLGQFLAMTFVPGPTLADMLAQPRQSFAPAEVLAWADQILDALIYLHEQPTPVLHRDIKPQNLKLTPAGSVILLDFGLARGTVFQTRQAGQRSVVGYTLPYAPIEQVRGLDTDPRSDLFALASTLYHLLTGPPPPDALERAAAQISGYPDPLKPLHDRCPALPLAAAEAITQCLRLDPAERVQSARELRWRLRQTRATRVPIQRRRPQARLDQSWPLRTFWLTLMLAGAMLLGIVPLPRPGSPETAYTSGAPYAPPATPTYHMGPMSRYPYPYPQADSPPYPSPTALPEMTSAPFPTPDSAANRRPRVYPTPIAGGAIAILTPTPGAASPGPGTPTPVAGTVREVLRCHSGFNQFGVSSGGQVIAIDCDQRTQVIRIADGKTILSFGYRPQALALSHDRKMLAVSAYGDEIQIWRLADRHMVQLLTPLPSSIPLITRLAFSVDGKTLIASDGGSRMIALELASGKILKLFRGGSLLDSPFIFSRSGRYYALMNDSDLEIWEYADGRFPAKPLSSFPVEFGYSIAFSADERSLLLGTSSGHLHRYSLAGEDTELPLRKLYDRPQIAASPIDNRIIAIGDGTGKVAIYQEGNSPAEHMLRQSGPYVKSIVFTPDGQAIMIFTEHGFETVNLGDLIR